MAKFITRVELHTATENDYVQLHSAMLKEGFSRFIVADNGVRHHLPTAEYIYEGFKDLSNIFVSAERAAQSTGRSSWIIVAEYVRSRFTLPIAQ